MSEGYILAWIGAMFVFAVYWGFTFHLIKETRSDDIKGGRIRPIPFAFLWPFALIAMLCSIACVRRTKIGPTDQATADDFLMAILMRALPQARVQKFILRARRTNWQMIVANRSYYKALCDLEEEQRKRRILVRLKAAQIAVGTVERCIGSALDSVSEEIAKKIVAEVHQRFQNELKADIGPVDV